MLKTFLFHERSLLAIINSSLVLTERENVLWVVLARESESGRKIMGEYLPL